MSPQLELNDIQGNTVFGYRFPHTRYLFIRVDRVESGRRFLRSILADVTTSARWESRNGSSGKPSSTLNVAISYAGFVALGLPARSLASFPCEYQQGMLARATLNHDTGCSEPSRWDEVWRTGAVHVLLSIYGRDVAALDEKTSRIEHAIAEFEGVSLAGRQGAGKLFIDGEYTEREHFGYRDGIGNPDVDGTGVAGRPGRGKLSADGSWLPLAAGEFILGQPDEAQENPIAPVPVQLARNGTFMVFRKLHQNVASFRRYLGEQGRLYAGGRDLLAAKFVGRWWDGTPLELSPDRADPALVGDENRNNDFRYTVDPEGVRCPLSSHIRRANPRDADGFGGTIANRHRIIRRGVSYGPWTPEGKPGDDESEHGFIFVALNASIERQFEFVQQQWMNYGNDFLQGNDRDLLVGTHRPQDKMVIQGDPARRDVLKRPFLCTGLPQFVETRGGDYFFVPGMNALRHIANGTVETH